MFQTDIASPFCPSSVVGEYLIIPRSAAAAGFRSREVTLGLQLTLGQVQTVDGEL